MTKPISRIFVFFPVYNEGRSAGALLARIGDTLGRAGLTYHVVAVDDGSSDDSVEHLMREGASQPFTLLRHHPNRGLRAALRTGISWLSSHIDEHDCVVFMDGDDTHDPSQISEMVRCMETGDDIVIASRFRRGATIFGLSPIRRFLSLGAATIGMLIFRIPGVRDYSCGYRAVRGSLLKKVATMYGDQLFELEGVSFICCVELLLKLGASAKKIGEVPLVLHYGRKEAPSKMRAFRMIRSYVSLWHIRDAILRRAEAIS